MAGTIGVFKRIDSTPFSNCIVPEPGSALLVFPTEGSNVSSTCTKESVRQLLSPCGQTDTVFTLSNPGVTSYREENSQPRQLREKDTWRYQRLASTRLLP